MVVAFPCIGDVVTPLHGAVLCDVFSISYSSSIRSNPTAYKSFTFDGVSGMSETLARVLTKADNEYVLTYECALPHDLAYAYGCRGDKKARRDADNLFEKRLVQIAGVSKWRAKLAKFAVRVFGNSRSTYMWGFATF